jgi:hypothetical protein
MTTNATIKGEKIILNPVRLAFPELFEAAAFTDPKTGKQGAPQFQATFLLDREGNARKVIEAEEERVAKEKWGAKANAILTEIRANNRGAIKPGELKASYDGFPGNDFVACNNKVRPTVVDRTGAPVASADGLVYAGCYGIGHVVLWAQDNAFGKRINANVTGFQFLRDGDAFGGGPPPSSAEEFENLGEGGGEESALLDD